MGHIASEATGATLKEGSGPWAIEEAVTRYEGFVRMSPRRGFHLLDLLLRTV